MEYLSWNKLNDSYLLYPELLFLLVFALDKNASEVCSILLDVYIWLLVIAWYILLKYSVRTGSYSSIQMGFLSQELLNMWLSFTVLDFDISYLNYSI